MSDGMSSSGSCPPSAEDLRARVEGANMMGKIGMSSSGSCPPSAEDLSSRVEEAKRMEKRGKKWRQRRILEREEREERERRMLSSVGVEDWILEREEREERERRMLSSVRVEESEERRMLSSVRVEKRGRERERAERMRWIEELVSNSRLKNNPEGVPMAGGEDEELKGPLIHPFFHLDVGRLGLADEDHHGESMNLEAEVKLKGEDEDHHGESPKLEAQMKMEGKKRVFVVLDDEVWESEEPKPRPPPRRVEMEDGKEVDVWRMMEPEEPELEVMEPDDEPHWTTVRRYRIHWEKQWSSYCGSFEDTTRIPPMRFTDNANALDQVYVQRDTLQVYSVKLAATRGSLQLPLDVFGMIAVRDPIDHNRNIIFQRKRDECHTLTEKDPYFVLEGPTRAVMFSDLLSDPVIIEVDLKVKGAIESEDEYLSFLVSPLICSGMLSHVFKCGYTSKLSRLEFTLGHIVFSVEATIFVRVIHGSWPDGLRGLFTASTTGYSDRSTTEFSTGVVHERIILLDSGDQGVAVAGDGKIKLSRNVISTEHSEEVIFQVKALKGDIKVVEKDVSIHSLEENKSISVVDIGFCKIEVTVVWSRVSDNP